MKNTERIWNEEDICFLKDNYKKLGIEYCSKKLNRTRLATARKASKIGISSKNNMWRFSKEDFIEIIKNSRSIKDVLLKMNLRAAGGNYRTVHKYIDELKLDTSHFKTKEEIGKNVSLFNKKPIEYYLTENNTSSSSGHLKERLFNEGFKKRECEKCSQGEIWNGEKMSLILDHINGNHYDWRLVNLRILCPNCNATLDTHCRGHKYIEGKRLKDEMKKENKNKYNLSRRKSQRPSHEQLKKEVEEIGYVKTGKKYNVSNTAIKKWIKSYEENKL